MTRATPFDRTFGELAEHHFGAIREEGRSRNSDLADPAQFASLPTSQRALAVLAAPEVIEDRPEAADEYLTTLYVMYRFWDAGQRVISVDRARFEQFLHEKQNPTAGQVPSGACYVQLPERWFWAQIGRDAPHEPVDGVYLANSKRELIALAVLGFHPGRTGFSQVVVHATHTDWDEAGSVVRQPPFEPTIEGGRSAGLRSVASVAELLYLARLALTEVSE